MSFVSESISTEFGVPGITIEQTLLNPFDPYSGMDIDITTFQNTNQGLEASNNDGRIELGMFSFNDDNIASDNFPNVLGPPFRGITKTNMVNNGNCKFVEKTYYEEDNLSVIVKPEGDWKYLSLKDSPSAFDYFYTTGDSQGFKAYGGEYSYAPLSLEVDGTAGINYWGNVKSTQDFSLKGRYIVTDLSQITINNNLNDGTLNDFRNKYKLTFNAALQPVPHIAAWVVTDEAYSNKKCLCFINFQIWNQGEVFNYLRDDDEKYIFNWLAKSNNHTNGKISSGSVSSTDTIEHHQYRVLNQVQKVYDKFNDEPINPYSSLKIKFKMKTTHVLPPNNNYNDIFPLNLFANSPLDTNVAPQVEVGILQSQFEETPNSGVNGLPSMGWNEYFKAPGSFNSKRYFNGETFDDKFNTEIGGMNRFQNSTMNEWETFEFTYNLSNEHNNRGEIYGVPYGGSFDDEKNGGPVEIMLNFHAADDDDADPGIPDATNGPAEIYFKVPGYDSDAPAEEFWITPPPGVGLSDGNTEGESVFVKHGDLGNEQYMTVVSELGEASGTSTGLQSDGRFLEAYLMYIGGLNLVMQDGLGYGQSDTNPKTDMVVAYWNGERWTYDNNDGYTFNNQFTPTEECFIIARLYGADGDGITGIDQYIDNESEFPTDGIGNLSLFLQSGNNFNGRVLIDDIECYESYEFTPDVNVRKKKSVGNYGLADLTKYYDKEIETEKYKDTQAPLEAQFYFYPQYPTNETFVERTPIYQDFQKGRFYIYDIDWGDGTPREFTSEPEQIDENIALYHTYEFNGVFEVTGTMIRVKTDSDDNIVGVAYNKKFKLRININEGLDEDFQYFGSDGYSFIPYKNTIPVIGGISNQSNYYKKIKRQIGFLNNGKISIEFKNKSDKLKTELALLKIENQSNSDLEVLPNYMIERFDNQGFKIYNGISPIKEELGKSIGDVNLTSIKYYNTPKSMWEMLGFEEYDLDEVGKPDEPRYWKNIIPDYFPISNRSGLTNELTVSIGGRQDGESGTPPHYNIIINGVKYYDGFVEDSNPNDGPSSGQYNSIDFNIPIDRSLDIQEIRINYDNNSTPPIIEGDRALYVRFIEINGELFDTFTLSDTNPSTHDDINVYYDSPSIYNYMEDNPTQETYNENGVSSGGAMFFNGNMVFEIPTKYFKTSIDFTSEQEWNDNYYYPVLPKFGADGKFIENNFTNNNIPFPIQSNITKEDESNSNLLINIVNEKNDVEVFNDNSGNKNYGFSIQDFSPKFDEKTLRVEKNKKRSIFKTSKRNGAY